MRICHSHYGHLLDDRSAPTTYHELDSGVCISSFWHHEYWRCLHSLHESMKTVFLFSLNAYS